MDKRKLADVLFKALMKTNPEMVELKGAEFIAHHMMHVIKDAQGKTLDELLDELVQHLTLDEERDNEDSADEKKKIKFSDPAMKAFMANARAKYPWLGDDVSILFKMLERSMGHSMEEDETHTKAIKELNDRVSELEHKLQQLGASNVENDFN